MSTQFIHNPPIQKVCNRNPSFLAADSNYWVTRTLWLKLLNRTLTARGWPTVFLSDIEAQVINSQPVAPLIVA